MVDPHAPWIVRVRNSPRLREPGWVLLPLRAFLGVTFIYAGWIKLTDPTFLDPTNLNSVHAQMVRAAATSPIGPVVRLSAHFSTLTGLGISFGEIAVGIGILLGLWTRIAALGGLLLSLSFFLTVSWTTRPYFYGSDIVFMFAWTPLILAGDGGVLSLPAAVRRSVRHQMNLPDVPDRAERPAVIAQVDRRTVVRTGSIAAAIGAVIAMAGGAAAFGAHRRATGDSPSTTAGGPGATASGSAGSTTAGASGGTKITSTSSVPVGGAHLFNDPKTGQPAYVVQPSSGSFKAFSAVCTHQGCQVGFSGGEFVCPCHGSMYNGATGAVLNGPATRPLPSIAIDVSNGTVFET
jgi:thiosulfate dehydrogenase (quinone) large subunit